MSELMAILSLIFSVPGATIFVATCVLIALILFLCFTEKFRGLTASYKNIKLRIPSAKPEMKPTPLEVIENPPAKISSLTSDPAPSENAADNQPPILKLFDAVEERNREAIEKIIEELKQNPPFGFSSSELDVFGLYQLVRAGFSDAIQKLREVESSDKDSVQASRYLVDHYIDARSFEKANLHISTAKQRAKTDKQKVTFALLESRILQLEKDKTSAAEFLEVSARDILDSQERFRLYDEASKLFKDSFKIPRAIAVLEQAVSCLPENIDARFRLAMMYSEFAALKSLAIRHYNIILRQEPNNTGALNNIGILYGELDLPIQKVMEIRKAANQEDSHAIGNLASMLIDEGFVSEAEEVLKKAKEKDSERVLYARQRLQQLVSANDKKREEVDERSEGLATSLSGFQFDFPFDVKKYHGKWVGSNNHILEISNAGFYDKISFSDEKKKLFSNNYFLDSIRQVEFSATDQAPKNLLFMTTDKVQEITFLFGKKEIRTITLNDNGSLSVEDFKPQN